MLWSWEKIFPSADPEQIIFHQDWNHIYYDNHKPKSNKLKINKKEVFSFIKIFSCRVLYIPLRVGSDFEICFCITLSTSQAFQNESKYHSVASWVVNENDFIEAVSQRWGGNQAWHVIGDSWQGINVGGGGKFVRNGPFPCALANQRIFTGTYFFLRWINLQG